MKVTLTLDELTTLCDWAEDQFTSVKKTEPEYAGQASEIDVVYDGKHVRLVDPELGEISVRPIGFFLNPEDYLL